MCKTGTNIYGTQPAGAYLGESHASVPTPASIGPFVGRPQTIMCVPMHLAAPLPHFFYYPSPCPSLFPLRYSPPLLPATLLPCCRYSPALTALPALLPLQPCCPSRPATTSRSTTTRRPTSSTTSSRVGGWVGELLGWIPAASVAVAAAVAAAAAAKDSRTHSV